MSSSDSDSSSKRTPQPGKFKDFDFFDSDDEGDIKKKQNEKSKTTKANRSLKSPHYELHGSGVKKAFRSKSSVQNSSESSDNDSEHDKKKTYTTSTKLEVKRVYRSESTKKIIPDKEKVPIHVPHEGSFVRSSSKDDDSSSSVTDVSPLPSPEPSPRLRRSRTNKKTRSVDNVSNGGTKTKFMIQEADIENEERPKARRSNGEALSIEDLFNSSDSTTLSSGDRVIEAQKKKRVQRKKKSQYEEIQLRMEASSRHHRRRLLDTAAENSMDLSQLLEVVLEMEQEKKARQYIAADQSSRSIGLSVVNPPHKKNMSFSNERVRNIDHENQRLLQRLAQLNTRQHRPSSASSIRSSASSCRSNTSRGSRRPATSAGRRSSPSQGPRLYHSATNRVRDQQRIERENLAFLKRLQMTKASGVLKRENLLRDYQRQTGRPVEPIRPRRKQKSTYRDEANYDNRSMNYEQRKARPVWQDSW